MRITVVISLVLIAQTSASLFSGLSSSMSSVGSSVGKLFSDVASDVKDTFDCTYIAVRLAFSSDSTVPDYYNKCQPQKSTNIVPLSTSGPIQIYIDSPANVPVYENNKPTTREQKDLKTVPKSIINDETNKEMENVLLEESLILANMSKMEHEFEDLSKHVNDDFEKLENERNRLSMETVMKEINKLHQEETYKNNTESEILDLFVKLLSKFEKNETQEKLDFRREIESAIAAFKQNNNITGVEQELEKWKVDEIKSINELKDLLRERQQNEKNTNETVTNRVTSFKQTTTAMVPTTTPTVVVSTVKPTTTTKTVTKTPNSYDYLVTKDKKALDQANKLIAESRKKASIMRAILKDHKHARNVFDNPKLLIRGSKSDEISMYNGFINNINK